MAGQFEVDPKALRSASSQFGALYRALVSSISSFQDHALDVNGAFGFLGPSVSVLQQYEQATEHAFRALDHLAVLLESASTALTQSAANYERSDQLSTMPTKP